MSDIPSVTSIMDKYGLVPPQDTEPLEVRELRRQLIAAHIVFDDTVRRLSGRVAELEAIVQRLPVTADGVPVVPQLDTVWDSDSLTERKIDWRHNPRAKANRKNGWWTCPASGMAEWSETQVSDCYSSAIKAHDARESRIAALAAKENQCLTP